MQGSNSYGQLGSLNVSVGGYSSTPLEVEAEGGGQWRLVSTACKYACGSQLDGSGWLTGRQCFRTWVLSTQGDPVAACMGLGSYSCTYVGVTMTAHLSETPEDRRNALCPAAVWCWGDVGGPTPLNINSLSPALAGVKGGALNDVMACIFTERNEGALTVQIVAWIPNEIVACIRTL